MFTMMLQCLMITTLTMMIITMMKSQRADGLTYVTANNKTANAPGSFENSFQF